MINRRNWQLSKKYLLYRSEVHQLAASSVDLEERWLKHVLEWAGPTPFSNAQSIRPVLPTYLITARKDISGKELSRTYTEKIIGCARRFFSWLNQHEVGYKKLSTAWLDTLRPPPLEIRSQKVVAITLEEILEIARAPTENLEERRIKAACCFWFLSGIRIGAFVTLPIRAINLEDKEVFQWPELGVHTKLNKRETTYLLDIPELITVVSEWDREIRKTLNPACLWFAPISPKTGLFEQVESDAGKHRDTRARKSLKSWMEKSNLTYKNPHSFRHGHAVYALKCANNIADLKAISRNLMHNSIEITDRVYGVFSDGEVSERIKGLSSVSNNSSDTIKLLETVLTKLKNEQIQNQK